MITRIKIAINKEFRSNGMDIQAKVVEYAWQNNIPTAYEIMLLYAGSRSVMKVLCNAQYPFVPKVLPVNFIEPHKLIRLCEIIQEAFKELERDVNE